MSKQGNKGNANKGAAQPAPDASIRGIHVGERSGVAKGSYVPTSQAPPPPPPKTK